MSCSSWISGPSFDSTSLRSFSSSCPQLLLQALVGSQLHLSQSVAPRARLQVITPTLKLQTMELQLRSSLWKTLDPQAIPSTSTPLSSTDKIFTPARQTDRQTPPPKTCPQTHTHKPPTLYQLLSTSLPKPTPPGSCSQFPRLWSARALITYMS